MNAVFNGNIVNVDSLSIEVNNRGFLYGDGLFETIIVKRKEILFFQYHIERLHRGMQILKLESAPALTGSGLLSLINYLVDNNQLDDARIKLVIWRSHGGLFVPENNDTEFLLLANKLEEKSILPRKVDFCYSVALHESIYSEFKRLSSLPYILAGIEMQETGMDDLILLDTEGNVSECISSNIFWKTNDEYFTPSLDTGCVAGIRRKSIIEKLKKDSLKIHQVKAQPQELLKADHIFSTNVAGIYPIKKVGTTDFDTFLPDL